MNREDIEKDIKANELRLSFLNMLEEDPRLALTIISEMLERRNQLLKEAREYVEEMGGVQ